MKFKYKVKTKTGEIKEGVANAVDKFALARDLKLKEETPFSIKEISDKKGILSFDFKNIIKKVSLSEKVMFANNLSGMISAGVSLSRALAILDKQTRNLMFKDILQSLINTINGGGTLSDGMRKFPKVFSELFVAMVRAGEESGGLSKSLKEVGENLHKVYALRKKIKGAMMYPMVILCAMTLIGILMLIFVVPTLTKTFTDVGTKLPTTTQFIIWLSDFIKNNFLIFIGVIIAIVIIFIILIRQPKTKKFFDYIVLKIPVVSVLIKEINSARTARTFSSLLSSGVDISKALSITKEVLQNIYYKNLISDSIKVIEKGETLSSVFKEREDLYPIMMGEMIEVGEETGKLSVMLLDIATFYESEVDAKTNNLSSIIEPVLMVVIGSAVGFFAVSMLSPMYSVMESIN